MKSLELLADPRPACPSSLDAFRTDPPLMPPYRLSARSNQNLISHLGSIK